MTIQPLDGAASMPIESAALPGDATPPSVPGSSPAACSPPELPSAAGDPTSSPRQRVSLPAAEGSSDPAGATSSRVAPAAGREQNPGGTAHRAEGHAVPPGSRPAYLRGGGVTLTATARCLRCDWTEGPGDPADVDKAAERHTTKPPKHPTVTVAEPAGRAA